MVGVVLLFLARAVARRIDAAWTLSIAGALAGIVTSLLKGGDYEEAALLGLLACALLASRKRFDRKAALFDTPLSGSWFVGTGAVVAASIFLGTFAFRHVDYSHDLWWHFTVMGNAPRFLRATVGGLALALALAFQRLLRPAPPEPALPTADDLAQAAAIAAASPRSANCAPTRRL